MRRRTSGNVLKLARGVKGNALFSEGGPPPRMNRASPPGSAVRCLGEGFACTGSGRAFGALTCRGKSVICLLARWGRAPAMATGRAGRIERERGALASRAEGAPCTGPSG